MIRNAQADAIPSSISLNEFGQAMNALDLSSIPEEKRGFALMNHLAKIVMTSATDRRVATDLSSAYLAYANAKR